MVPIHKSFLSPQRRSLRVAQWLSLALILQAVVGATLIHARNDQHGTDNNYEFDKEVVQIATQQQDMKTRLDGIDKLDIPARLAVLENRTGRIDENMTEGLKLLYGVLATVIGGLAVQFFDIRSRRRSGR